MFFCILQQFLHQYLFSIIPFYNNGKSIYLYLFNGSRYTYLIPATRHSSNKKTYSSVIISLIFPSKTFIFIFRKTTTIDHFIILITKYTFTTFRSFPITIWQQVTYSVNFHRTHLFTLGWLINIINYTLCMLSVWDIIQNTEKK